MKIKDNRILREKNYSKRAEQCGTKHSCCTATNTETDVVTHGMTMHDIVQTETDIVTHGMTMCDIVHTETDIVTHGMTMYDIVQTQRLMQLLTA